tara:strand:- start:108 stop:503 length:396 start_codon:yes stop_codon:yes gene_type:complete
MKYFKNSEFDSPDVKWSGKKMDKEFLLFIDELRGRCGFPFRITSGFRTKEYHESLTERGYQTTPKSAHLRGLAADIALSDAKKRAKFIFCAMELTSELGLPFRVGMAGKSKGNFAHIDIDTLKQSPRLWVY